MRYCAYKKVSADTNVDANRIRTKNNMSPFPSVGERIIRNSSNILPILFGSNYILK